tara:strand:- start:960 stop:1154 length:195 start_codon:yes stop_codon:yes gene_type:complete
MSYEEEDNEIKTDWKIGIWESSGTEFCNGILPNNKKCGIALYIKGEQSGIPEGSKKGICVRCCK